MSWVPSSFLRYLLRHYRQLFHQTEHPGNLLGLLRGEPAEELLYRAFTGRGPEKVDFPHPLKVNANVNQMSNRIRHLEAASGASAPPALLPSSRRGRCAARCRGPVVRRRSRQDVADIRPLTSSFQVWQHGNRMNAQAKPTVWRMVKEAVEALGGNTANVAVRDWILKKYPGTNPATIACQIIVCTVNHASRVHYSENQKPRKADAQYDFLFRPATGELEWDEPAKHGQWEIAELDDGKLVVREVGTQETDLGDGPDEAGNAFAAEAHLRDFLAKNLDVIEDGLQLYVDEVGTVGVEYKTEMGRMDIVAVDKNGGLLVVELKVERGPDEVCGQIMRYVGWLKRHGANGKPVRGLIIAKHVSDCIRYALADVPEVSAREYQLHITLKDVPHVDEGKQ